MPVPLVKPSVLPARVLTVTGTAAGLSVTLPPEQKLVTPPALITEAVGKAVTVTVITLLATEVQPETMLRTE